MITWGREKWTWLGLKYAWKTGSPSVGHARVQTRLEWA